MSRGDLYQLGSFTMQHPKVIFLDAVGTLIGVKGSVGEVYRNIAQEYGVDASPAALNQAFYQCFQAAEPLAFPNTAAAEIPALEFAWWLDIVTRTFQEVGVYNQFLDFSSFFADLYAHFASPDPWFVYPDVEQALENWQRQGIDLGVLSNLDSRLYTILQSFNLTPFFKSCTISSEAGAAKPDPHIFAIALEKHNCAPTEAWHIGDSYTQDYQAAKASGIKATWLRRN